LYEEKFSKKIVQYTLLTYFSLNFINNLAKVGKKLEKEISNLKKASKLKYDTDYASINLPFDDVSNVKKIVREKIRLKPEYIVLIGIGGSNLGAIAVFEAVLGKLYNQMSAKTKFLFLDTVDSDSVENIQRVVEPVLRDGKNILVNVVTKSGGTTETISNYLVMLKLLRKYKKDYKKYIVVTTGKDSNLWKIANDEGFSLLEIPEKVGGRYSVFSSVGLFPLALLGIDIDNLLKGAAIMQQRCLMQFNNNPAATSAAIHYILNLPMSNLFLFSNDLESVGKWYKQLMGESIGKEFTKKGKKVNNGITPTVSIGSTDLHSMAQLYLGGPYNRLMTFVRMHHNFSLVKVPVYDKYSKLVENIQGKRLKDIMNAILYGTEEAFKKGKRPFIEIIMPDKSEYSIGQFLQMKMMEIMYLAYLMDVNPFDQPNVEHYKKETKKILKNS
jgi:glucose-6-phosphate isomerase